MAEVFISYAREDKQWAERLEKLLIRNHLSTWIDDKLESGREYSNEIAKQLQAAKVVLVIWSKNSIKSKWVNEEALFARDHNKLIPVRIDDVKLRVPFYSIHTFDLSKARQLWLKRSLRTALIETIRNVIEEQDRTVEYTQVALYYLVQEENYFPEEADLSEYWGRVREKAKQYHLSLVIIHATHLMMNRIEIEKSESVPDFLIYFGRLEYKMGMVEDVIIPSINKFTESISPFIIQFGNSHSSHLDASPDIIIPVYPSAFSSLDSVFGKSMIDLFVLLIKDKVDALNFID